MRGIDIKRIGVGLAAVAFVLTASLGMVANVAAEDEIDYCDGNSENHNYYMCNLVGAEGVPEGYKIVANSANFDGSGLSDEEQLLAVVLGGKDKYDFFMEKELWIGEQLDNGEMTEDSDEFKKAITDIFDEIGLLFGEMSFVDIHLEYMDGNKVDDYDGGEITIKYRFGHNPLAEDGDFAEFINMSSRKWRPVIIHINDNNERELLPVEIDEDGVWTFKVSNFSAFMATLAAEEEPEAPKTGDGVLATIAMFGALSVAGAVICARMSARR